MKRRLLHKIKNEYITVRKCGSAHTTPKGNFSNYSKGLFRFFPTATTKKPRPTFCHCRLPQFAFCIVKLHITLKTFTLAYPGVSKSKYKTHPRYTVIIKRYTQEI